MPVNLNALIRYRTIDECLANPYLECTISVFVMKCSEKLAEFQGVESGVSERTIRNDIRILRSDTLGFNAPIVVNKGIYSYDNPAFTIFGKSIKELELLADIQELLVAEFGNLRNNHKNLSELLLALSRITNIKIPIKCYPSYSAGSASFYKKLYAGSDIISDNYKKSLKNYIDNSNTSAKTNLLQSLFKIRNKEIFKWNFIFEILIPKI